MGTKTRGVISMVAGCLALGWAGGVAGAELALVREGKPAAVIMLPEQSEFMAYGPTAKAQAEAHFKTVAATGRLTEAEVKKELAKTARAIDTELKKVGDEELLAAQELNYHLKKMTGAELAVVRGPAPATAPDGMARIILGAAFARLLGCGDQLDALEPDGFIIQTRGSDLVVAGRRARGTLYAAYHLLESLGCRWVMPGEFGEIVPRKTTAAVELNLTVNPAHRMRYSWATFGQGDGYARWWLRNKGNLLLALGDKPVRQSHAWSGPLDWGKKQDKYRVKVVRPVTKTVTNEKGEKVKETKDEEVWDLPDDMYASANGKPVRHSPNFSNPRTWELFAEYFIDYFDRNPLEAYASLSATDGIIVDEHPESQKLLSGEFDFAMGAQSATDMIWFFANRVIERVERVYPDKKFGILVYSNNLTPPRLEAVNPKMALVFAPLGISPLHDIRDPKSKTNRWYRPWLESWMAQARAAGAETYYYDYEPTGFSWVSCAIAPRWGIIGRNYPYLHELGLNGHTTQGHDDWTASGLNNYLMARLHWDGKADYREIIADYCRARFGKAAGIMEEYYRVLEERMNEIPDMCSNEPWDNHLILTPAVRARCRALLEQAQAAADTPEHRAQLEAAVLVQQSTDAFCDAIELERETADFAAAAEKMGEIFKIQEKLNKLYSHFMHPERVKLNDKPGNGYLAGGIHTQYRNAAEKIAAAPAKLALPRIWKGRLDTDNLAQTQGLHRPDAPAGALARLEDLDTTEIADIRYGTQREVAAFFFRCQIKVPESFAGRKSVKIFFPAVIARAMQIWVNGQAVSFQREEFAEPVWRGPKYFWFNYDHAQEFELGNLLKPGTENTIVFRIFKSYDHAGPYRRIWLLAE